MRSGLDLYLSKGTAAAEGLTGHRVHMVSSEEAFSVGTFDCVAFKTEHDAAEPLGFVLTSRFIHERILYATDTCFLEFTVPDVTHWIIECNFDEETLTENIESGKITKELGLRIKRRHMNLQNLIKTLAANDLTKTMQIYLVHLSDRNGFAEMMKTEVQKLTDAKIIVTQK